MRGSLLVAILLLAAACARSQGPPRVRLGAPCAACGMAIRDARFACVLREGGKDRQYDSIECLLEDGPPPADASAHLADYDWSVLHTADSLWVVKGDFPSPMGGGLAAFSALESAREIAARTSGRVGRLAELAPEVAR